MTWTQNENILDFSLFRIRIQMDPFHFRPPDPYPFHEIKRTNLSLLWPADDLNTKWIYIIIIFSLFRMRIQMDPFHFRPPDPYPFHEMNRNNLS